MKLTLAQWKAASVLAGERYGVSCTSATPPVWSCARKSCVIWKSTCSVCLVWKEGIRTHVVILPLITCACVESRSLRRSRPGVGPRPEAAPRPHVARRVADGPRGRQSMWPMGHVADGPCGRGRRLAPVRQDHSTVFVAETLPTKRPVRPPAVGAQQLEAGGKSGEPGVAASCTNTVATSPPPAAAPTSSAASTVSTTQQHEYLGGQHRRLGGASRRSRGEAFKSGASCSMLCRVTACVLLCFSASGLCSARKRAVLTDR